MLDFYGEGLLALCPTPKLEDRPLILTLLIRNFFSYDHHYGDIRVRWHVKNPPLATVSQGTNVFKFLHVFITYRIKYHLTMIRRARTVHTVTALFSTSIQLTPVKAAYYPKHYPRASLSTTP